MQISSLTANILASDQVQASDMAAIAAVGIHSIICSRPDGEGSDQPLFADLESAAKEFGIETRYLPAQPGKVLDEHGQEFGELIAELPKPILAFCKTGMRAATMWALSESGKQSQDAILGVTKAAGYDLEALRSRLVMT